MTLRDMTAAQPARSTALTAALRAALRAPVSSQARQELLFCLAELPFAIPVPLAGFFLTILLGRLFTQQDNPPAGHLIAALGVAVLLVVLLVVTGAARRIGAAWRRLALVLPGERVAPPPSRSRGGLAARLRDRPGWRALGYLMAKFPVALLA